MEHKHTPGKKIQFTGTKTFEALDAAQDYLRKNGYSFGSLQRQAPIAIKKGDYIIGKWRNLSVSDKAEMDGIIEGDFRDGPVEIKFKAATHE